MAEFSSLLKICTKTCLSLAWNDLAVIPTMDLRTFLPAGLRSVPIYSLAGMLKPLVAQTFSCPLCWINRFSLWNLAVNMQRLRKGLCASELVCLLSTLRDIASPWLYDVQCLGQVAFLVEKSALFPKDVKPRHFLSSSCRKKQRGRNVVLLFSSMSVFYP